VRIDRARGTVNLGPERLAADLEVTRSRRPNGVARCDAGRYRLDPDFVVRRGARSFAGAVGAASLKDLMADLPGQIAARGPVVAGFREPTTGKGIMIDVVEDLDWRGERAIGARRLARHRSNRPSPPVPPSCLGSTVCR